MPGNEYVAVRVGGNVYARAVVRPAGLPSPLPVGGLRLGGQGKKCSDQKGK